MPDVLKLLLQGRWPDPDGGPAITVPVRAVVIERSLRGSEADIVAPLQLGRRLAIVSDARTQQVLGERVERALAGIATIVPLHLDGVPHADLATAEIVRQGCSGADAIVAVGAGTINDLCKYAAALEKKPYAVFATAPSMNGYTSANAAITVDGHKKSLPAAAPAAVFMDLEVLAAAPARMIRAGLGDSLCRPTAQADWLLSHVLRGTSYRHAPFALLEADEPALLENPEALVEGDIDAIGALARTLVLSGFGMTICGGSYPASQGEHLISHYIDMFAPAGRAEYFHGEQVAVATLTMARIQEHLLSRAPPAPTASTVTSDQLRSRFGVETGETCWREFEKKRLDDRGAADLAGRIDASWQTVRARVAAAAIPAARLSAVLQRIGGPTKPADIGLSPDFYAMAVRNARYLRDRYTFLDLADDAGDLAQFA
jgi:glycerol-1-phosphate dehydrogenase [NAD(P)+]